MSHLRSRDKIGLALCNNVCVFAATGLVLLAVCLLLLASESLSWIVLSPRWLEYLLMGIGVIPVLVGVFARAKGRSLLGTSALITEGVLGVIVFFYVDFVLVKIVAGLIAGACLYFVLDRVKKDFSPEERAPDGIYFVHVSCVSGFTIFVIGLLLAAS